MIAAAAAITCAIALSCPSGLAGAQTEATPTGSACLAHAPRRASDYTSAFAAVGHLGTGWVAGDGAVPIDLSRGHLLWVFGDTFVGDRASDGSLVANWALVHNSIVEQRGRCFRPEYGGTRTEPLSFVAVPGADRWLWPTGGVATRDRVYVFALRVTAAPGPPGFAWSVTGSAIATLARPDLSVLAIDDLPAAPSGPVYGREVATDHGYLYAYGTSGDDHYVARARVAALPLGPWTFQTSRGWSADPAAAVPLHIANQQGAVLTPTPNPGGTDHASRWLAPGLTDLTGGPVRVWRAPAAQGPWTPRTTLARPVAPTGVIVYGNRLVELPGAGVVFEDNTNAPAEGAVPADPSLYGPRFFPLSGRARARLGLTS